MNSTMLASGTYLQHLNFSSYFSHALLAVLNAATLDELDGHFLSPASVTIGSQCWMLKQKH